MNDIGRYSGNDKDEMLDQIELRFPPLKFHKPQRLPKIGKAARRAANDRIAAARLRDRLQSVAP